MKWIIPTSDKYRNIIEANKYTTDKFGGLDLDVIVLGYKKPDFDMGNWKFISLGDDLGPKTYSNGLLKFFNDFNEEFFVFGNDDIVVVDNLDLELLEELKNIMIQDQTIGRIAITTASIKNFPLYDEYKQMKDYKLVEAPRQNDNYRLSLHYSIWRTSYFKKYLIPDITPWEWELRDSAKNDGYKILKTVGRYVLDFGHIFRKDRGVVSGWEMSEYTKKSLSEDDKKIVINSINKVLNNV